MEIWPSLEGLGTGRGRRGLDWGLGETGSWTDWGRAGTPVDEQPQRPNATNRPLPYHY